MLTHLMMDMASKFDLNSAKIGNVTWYRVLWMIVIVLIISISQVSSRKGYHEHKGKSHLVTQAEWSRRRSKGSECRLGGARHPLNSTWSPDLGPPFGVWNCVKCTCTPVQKKRRIVAKVICQNIKTQCPVEPKCKNPVLYPGACCKVCLGDDFIRNPDFIREEAGEDIDTLAKRDFAVLLNGRTSRSPLTTRRLATGRIFLRRGTLHYSFVVDSHSPPYTTVQFLSEDGNILEEMEVQPTPYEVNNGRICGTWTRVPRQYRILLLKKKMWVALLANEDEEPISGRIARYQGVQSEVFSALMSPVQEDQEKINRTLPAGGTAIISVSAPSDSLHISLVFNGIFRSNDERNVPIKVELRPSRSLEPVLDTIILSKVFSDVNEAQLKTTLGETSLRLLTRGKVKMRVWSTTAPGIVLEGLITSRATCNVYHSVLSSSPEVSGRRSGDVAFPGAGWGLLYLSNEGDFKYTIRLEGLTSQVEEVVLQTAKRRRVRHVEDVTHALSHGWVNGTYGKPTYRDLDALLRDRLLVSVLLTDGATMEGTFEAVSVTEALRSLHPVLLMTSSSWMAATAWVAVDADCVMHYDVRLTGSDPAGGYDPTWALQLRENDTVGPTAWDPRLDSANVTLEHRLTGREIASHTTLLTKVSLSRLFHGVSYLDLSVSSSDKEFVPSINLTGHLADVEVPLFCRFEEEQGGAVDKKPEEGVQVDAPCKGFICLAEEGHKPIISKKCIDDDKKVYEDGTTWKSPLNNCARCMCTLGRIKCEDEPCPKASCSNAILLPGQCCPSCPVVSGRASERVCEMDGDFHIIGAFWHPFLAPNGFDNCVTCYCNITSTSFPLVECRRVDCPQLNCLYSEATFVDNSCCPKCPVTTASPRITPKAVIKGMLSEDEGTVTRENLAREQVLAEGGCLERKRILRPNGATWFPKLSPNGVQRCVSCTCKNGEISCVGMKCLPQDCKGKKCRKRKGKGKGKRGRKAKSKKFFSRFDDALRRKKNRRRFRKRRLG